MNQEQRDERKNTIALFRYGLISPIVTNTYEDKSQMEYFRKIAGKEYELLGKKIKFKPESIKKWYLDYKKNGYQALIPKTRTDLHTSRKLTDDTIEKIKEYKNNYPHITGTLIYYKLIEEGYIKEYNVSKSTVLKYIRDNYLLFESQKQDRRAFEMEFANDMWDADTSHGPYLTINGKKVKTYLIALIDDASRLITNAKFYFADNAINFQNTFKGALKKYGIPKRIFLDNGKTYRNEQLSIICANVGMQLIYTKPYSPESKAKIERWFHTMKETWMRGINWQEINSLDKLNEMLDIFINDYNNKTHSSLKNDKNENISPKTRWFSNQDKIKKIDNNLIDEYFLHTAYPTIRSDAIAYVKKIQYEVPAKYIGKKITIKYDFSDRKKAWIYENNKKQEEIKIVNKIENSKIKRKETLY